MYQEDFFDALAQDFPALCSPERVAVKQRRSVGRDRSKTQFLSPVTVNDEDSENRENVLPQRLMTPAPEQSVKKAKKNKAKKARRQANQALREAHEQYLRRIFVSRDEEDCSQAVEDALLVIREEGALNEQVLRRLSVEKFTPDSLRRLSACKLEPLPATEDTTHSSEEIPIESEQIDVVEALRNFVTLIDIMEETVTVEEPVVPKESEIDHQCFEKNHDRRRRRELINEIYDDELVSANEFLSQTEQEESLNADLFRDCLRNQSISLHVQDHTFTPTHVEYVVQVMVRI